MKAVRSKSEWGWGKKTLEGGRKEIMVGCARRGEESKEEEEGCQEGKYIDKRK